MTPVLTSFGYDYISCLRFVGSVQKLLKLKKLILIIVFFFLFFLKENLVDKVIPFIWNATFYVV